MIPEPLLSLVTLLAFMMIIEIIIEWIWKIYRVRKNR